MFFFLVIFSLRETFVLLFGNWFAALYILLLTFYSLKNVLTSKLFKPIIVFASVFVVALIRYFSADAEGGVVTPILGISQLLLIPLFISILARGTDTKHLQNILIYFWAFFAITGIIQYYISPTLFGLILNDAQLLSAQGHNVTKRAVSFLSSPQSHGMGMAVAIGCVFFFDSLKIWMKLAAGSLFLISGMLSGSKMFVVLLSLLLVSLFVKYIYALKIRDALRLVLISTFGAIFSVLLLNEENVRILDVFDKVLNINAYNTAAIWLEVMKHDLSLTSFFAGNGLGVFSRASQTLYEYEILTGSAESFILQQYYEIGIVGIIIYVLFLRYLGFFRGQRFYFTLPILTASSFSPALYGYTLQFFVFLSVFATSGYRQARCS